MSPRWTRCSTPGQPAFPGLLREEGYQTALPDAAHADLYTDVDIPEPATLRDDYAGRSDAAAAAVMRIATDLNAEDLKEPVPEGLSG